MKRTDTQKFYLGLFVFISTIFLIAALYFIGKKQNIFGNTSKIIAVFNNVNGLQLGNNVRYSGINMGTVKEIRMKNDTVIYVVMAIEDDMLRHMKKNAVAAISSDGLVGSMVINILPAKEPAEYLKPGDTIRSVMRISSGDMLSTLSVTNKNAALLTEDLLKITKEINSGKGTLGKLVKDSVMAANLEETIRNLKITSMETSNTIKEFNHILSSVKEENNVVSVLLNDSVSANKLRSVIDHLDRSSNGIDSVITSLNDVVTDYQNGKGVLNTVVNDSVMAKDVEETIKNIKEGSVLLNENMEALKHNFMFRGYFKKLEKEKKKQGN